MNQLIIIAIAVFIIVTPAIIYLAKNSFKKMLGNENHRWKTMGDRTDFLRFAILVSFLITVGITFIIKYLFNL